MYDPIQDMKRQDQERDRLSYALMDQERAERQARDAASWKALNQTRPHRSKPQPFIKENFIIDNKHLIEALVPKGEQ